MIKLLMSSYFLNFSYKIYVIQDNKSPTAPATAENKIIYPRKIKATSLPDKSLNKAIPIKIKIANTKVGINFIFSFLHFRHNRNCKIKIIIPKITPNIVMEISNPKILIKPKASFYLLFCKSISLAFSKAIAVILSPTTILASSSILSVSVSVSTDVNVCSSLISL